MAARPDKLKLPPLNALRAFHAAMRHGTLRGAAEELLVTPQAVSQQIKHLEETLELILFERRSRSMEPTETAILLASYVEAGFEELAEGLRRVSARRHRERITLNVSPYFATRYLLPRMEQHRTSLPQANLRMMTTVEAPDFKRDDVDFAVQWGYGNWGDLESNLLLKDHKVICCTPALARGLCKPEDLLDQTLLHPVLQNSLWSDIFQHLGIEPAEEASELSFHDAATMRHATLSGLGVGLISTVDAAHDIHYGTLVAPFGEDVLRDLPCELVPGFYLVLPRAHRRIRSVAKFCDWLISQNWDEPLRLTDRP